ncbi:hypothetical protein LJC68_09855 [Bacteroidales bacterium OttesenSCG-928-B11]|nr:hypothetical protein [Bacteroidales bacterium OttesenSCG-928-C03]MDL2313164.1 hypothetical protein [Bacteroidales bacterium OttesenSCG-928-B11]MDL2326901.1 hypothetical protein [Bacteroidales bacterium OttesenSCG-928-A14]
MKLAGIMTRGNEEVMRNHPQYAYDTEIPMTMDNRQEKTMDIFLILRFGLVRKMNKPDVRRMLLRIATGSIHVA